MEYDGITIFTNEYMFSDLVDKIKTEHKIGWILESPVVKPYVYENIHSVEHKFDFIMVYDNRLITNPKYKLISAAHSRFADEEMGLFTKTKLMSHIVTNKRQTEGHILRHQIANQIRNIDVYQTPFDKVETHKRYKFSIVIENCRVPGYFTEKIIDCIMMGAIPIYWGDPLIHQWLDINGIIVFDNIQQLSELKLGKNEYENRYQHVVNNYNICRAKYLSVDDNIGILLDNLYNKKKQ